MVQRRRASSIFWNDLSLMSPSMPVMPISSAEHLGEALGEVVGEHRLQVVLGRVAAAWRDAAKVAVGKRSMTMASPSRQ